MGKMIMQVVMYILLVAGGLLICDGMWLKAKALLAQKMLQHAWEETQRTGVAVKPWPWADSWPVARLRAERLGVEQIVLEGDSGEVLAFGPGRLVASSMPGGSGNCVLAGHRDTSFAFLQELTAGDVLLLEAMNGQRYRFEVVSTEVVEAGNLYLEQSRESWLTLVTCYPFQAVQPGSNQRYVVFARLQPNPPAMVSEKAGVPSISGKLRAAVLAST